MTLVERITRRIEVDPSGCWIYTGGTNGDGYCQVQVAGRKHMVHRLIFELVAGPLDEGHQLDHLCRTRRCCNPTHLEPVTARENTLRGSVPSANRSLCRNGKHYLDQVGTLIDSEGTNRCRECRRESAARWRQGRRVGGAPSSAEAP